jgi:hypothetical protein
MVLKQYKLRLDFTVSINELTDEIVHESVGGFSNYDEIIKDTRTWKHAERQKRLLHALLANPDVLEKYVRKEVVGLFEVHANEEIKELFDSDEDEQELLMPVIDGLNKEDSEVFSSAIEDGLFSENTSEFSECFTIELINAEFREALAT